LRFPSVAPFFQGGRVLDRIRGLEELHDAFHEEVIGRERAVEGDVGELCLLPRERVVAEATAERSDLVPFSHFAYCAKMEWG
jgi:hypothetical protein